MDLTGMVMIMTACRWIYLSLLFWIITAIYGCAMAVMVFVLQMTEPMILLVDWSLRAFVSALVSFGCSMIGILGKLLGGVEGLVEDE